MTGRQIVGRILLAVLVVGLLAAAGYAIYRLGFNAGRASVVPMEDMRGFMFERAPRFEWPERMQPRLPEQLRPGVRVYTRSSALIWPWGLAPWIGAGVLLLAAGGMVAIVVVLFRWAFPATPKQAEAEPSEES